MEKKECWRNKEFALILVAVQDFWDLSFFIR